MLKENLIELYQKSFRENKELPALSDYFKKESFSYFEMAKEIAKLHLLFEEAGLQRGDKVALIGRNNPRWCIVYIATITYGAVIVPILQDFSPNDVHHIINHSDSVLLFAGDIYWDTIETDNIEQVRAAFSLTDFHCLYERHGDSLARFQREIGKRYRCRYPRGFTSKEIAYPKIDNDSVAVISYTSGTTGFSKGVMLTINNLTETYSSACSPNCTSKEAGSSRSSRWPTHSAVRSTSWPHWPPVPTSPCWVKYPRRRY